MTPLAPFAPLAPSAPLVMTPLAMPSRRRRRSSPIPRPRPGCRRSARRQRFAYPLGRMNEIRAGGRTATPTTGRFRTPPAPPAACPRNRRCAPGRARCSAGTSPSVTSMMKRRLVRWNGVLIRNPSPPTASATSPIRSATVSGEPMNSTSDGTVPNRSMRKLPQRLATAPLREFVQRPLFAVRGQSRQRLVQVELEKSMSVTVPIRWPARASMKAGEDTIRSRLRIGLRVGLGRASDRPGTAP